MMLVIVLLVISAYIFVGMFSTRSKYAVDAHRYRRSVELGNTDGEELRHAKAALKGFCHDSSCNLKYGSLARYGCDCRYREQYNNLRVVIQRLEAEGTLPPSLETLRVPLWPAYLAGDWMRSGKYREKGFDAEYTAMLESRLGIDKDADSNQS